MGMFGKKEMKNNERFSISEDDPALAQLPELPELPPMYSENYNERLPQLPTIPTNSFGERFSQNMIKDAVSGQEESGELNEDRPMTNDFRRGMMQTSSKRMTREIEPEEESYEIPAELRPMTKRISKNEPIFIRLDKFEESLHIFEHTKHKIYEIEKMLRDIKKIKEDEEKELNLWIEEVQSMKEKIDKIDRDLFSKVQ